MRALGTCRWRGFPHAALRRVGAARAQMPSPSTQVATSLQVEKPKTELPTFPLWPCCVRILYHGFASHLTSTAKLTVHLGRLHKFAESNRPRSAFVRSIEEVHRTPIAPSFSHSLTLRRPALTFLNSLAEMQPSPSWSTASKRARRGGQDIDSWVLHLQLGGPNPCAGGCWAYFEAHRGPR